MLTRIKDQASREPIAAMLEKEKPSENNSALNPRKVTLIKVTPKDLGYSKISGICPADRWNYGPSTWEIHRRAKQLGLAVCNTEIAIKLLLKMKKEGNGFTRLQIVMDPVEIYWEWSIWKSECKSRQLCLKIEGDSKKDIRLIYTERSLNRIWNDNFYEWVFIAPPLKQYELF